MSILRGDIPSFDFTIQVLVIGAGACGISAALAASDAGAEVLVLERDATPLGSTSMSTGLIPAAGTPEQAARNIDDSAERFAEDIALKTKGRADPNLALHVAQESAETIAWLRDTHAAPLQFVDGFLYPGHSRMRMYGTPNRSGSELQGALEAALGRTDASLLTNATVRDLYVDGEVVVGVRVERPDGDFERIGCQSLILACCGYGGDPEMVATHIPEMAEAVYHGHPGNRGDAVKWGQALGAELADMSGYQGHGGLAAGFGVPILWPQIMEGGFQINAHGQRFSNEAAGYSEQAREVNGQPGRVAWTISDGRLHDLMMGFEDYQDAVRAGAVQEAADAAAIAAIIGAPPEAVAQTLTNVESCVLGEVADIFGRDFTGKPLLCAPYRIAKVTGALFHTQGGLAVNADARVKKLGGGVFPNLFAGGGAARGLSGPGPAGYLAGNGLLTATTLGKLAGRAAAHQVTSGS
ncbi:FAD-dependent oxidoreductase [Caulobacter sp.]|uniref:FAD-dependent oxidoreductase n=1 Tax=Caulobacter sp. TaxID=78 RepID=UPI003BAB7D4E